MYKNWFWWVFSLQPSFTFSYYGRVGAQRHRMRHTGHFTPRPITTSQSLNDLSIIQRHTDRRRLQLSASSVSSEGSSSEGGTDKGGSVRLLWLSMLKVNFFFILLLQHWIMSTEMIDVPVINTACITFTLDAQSALEIMCVSPAHMVLHYSWSCVLYRFHGAGYFPRRPQGIHTSTHIQIPSKSHLYCCWSTTWHHLVFCIPWKPHSSAVDLAHFTVYEYEALKCQWKSNRQCFYFFSFFFKAPANSTELQNYHKGVQMGCWGLVVYAATAAVCSGKTQTASFFYRTIQLTTQWMTVFLHPAILQKYLDHFDLSIRVIYILGTLGFSVGELTY